MSKKDFEYFLEQKKESGILYQYTASNRNICGQCNYKLPWQNTCLKFNNNIKRVNQNNGGFHHLPCQECLNYKLQQSDLDYIMQCYSNRKIRK